MSFKIKTGHVKQVIQQKRNSEVDYHIVSQLQTLPLIGLNGHFMKPWAMLDLDINCYRSLAPSHRYQTYK